MGTERWRPAPFAVREVKYGGIMEHGERGVENKPNVKFLDSMVVFYFLFDLLGEKVGYSPRTLILEFTARPFENHRRWVVKPRPTSLNLYQSSKIPLRRYTPSIHPADTTNLLQPPSPNTEPRTITPPRFHDSSQTRSHTQRIKKENKKFSIIGG